MNFIDSHCHLDNQRFDDRAQVVERSLAAGVTTMLSIGTGDGPPDLEAGIRMAEQFDCVLATVGVHPHDAKKADESTFEQLADLCKHSKVVAVGETGFDYYYDNSPKDVQRQAFERQMRIAADAEKPIVIHTRDAWADTTSVLRDHVPAVTGVIHCFSGGPKEAEEAIELGYLLGFGGVLTFPKSDALREALRITPPDRILLETDAPFLAPVPNRGKRNEPAMMVDTARKAAEVRGVGLEEIARLSSDNFERFCLRYTERFHGVK